MEANTQQELSLDEIIEKLGRSFEENGALPRIAGRIFALLLVEEGPFSFEDLATRLKISRASISTNSRLLEERGMIERVSELGERRDFFRLAPNPLLHMTRIISARIEKTAALTEELARSFSPENTYARHNLMQAAQTQRALVASHSKLFKKS